MQLRAESADIAATLRQRICMMQSQQDDLTLHEGLIATEFGVSRTPIRQVLQRLAYERLVETRSGVGTIVAPLNSEHRTRDLTVLLELFRAASRCAGQAQPDVRMMERLTAARAVAGMAGRGAEDYLRIRTQLLEISSDAAPDTILGDAMRAAHWRQIRWRMADHAWQEEGIFDRLQQILADAAEEAEKAGVAGFYASLAASAT